MTLRTYLNGIGHNDEKLIIDYHWLDCRNGDIERLSEVRLAERALRAERFRRLGMPISERSRYRLNYFPLYGRYTLIEFGEAGKTYWKASLNAWGDLQNSADDNALIVNQKTGEQQAFRYGVDAWRDTSGEDAFAYIFE